MLKGTLNLLVELGLALLTTALLGGCGPTDTTSKVSAGVEAVLDKAMPARYGAVVIAENGAYLVFLKPPSEFEKLVDLFIWTGYEDIWGGHDSNAREGETTGGGGWYLSAHREGAHWMVDDTTLDPEKTSPADMVAVLQRCIADVEANDRTKAKRDQEAVADAKAEQVKARESTAAWLAVASGVVPSLQQEQN
jgi:hypothetical protein